MATDFDDYPAVGDDEEQRRLLGNLPLRGPGAANLTSYPAPEETRRLAGQQGTLGSAAAPPDYPPVAPPNVGRSAALNPLYQPVAPRQAFAPVAAPDMNRPSPIGDYIPVIPGGQTEAPVPRRPQLSDYPPVELHGWRKGLGALFTGMAAFGNPEEGERVRHRLFEEPRERAQQEYQAAASAYDTELQQGRQDRAETRAEEAERAKAELEAAQAKKAATPPARKFGRAVIDNPQKPGEPLAADFDPDSGAYINPDTGEAIAGAKPWEKPQKITNPFEAFTYGSPQEKQSAQDFLSFEKKIGQQYEKPGDVEQRYELYNRDPEAYKAMFGDRGAAQDEAQATRMLNYFDKRRKEISGDWALDETEKAKQLSEIDELQKPYMNAAGGNQDTDRVTVIHPNGTKGTIPRSQLKAAQKKGYKIPR